MKTISIKDKVTVEASAEIQAVLAAAWQTLASDKSNEAQRKEAARLLELNQTVAVTGEVIDSPATEDWLETVKVNSDVQGMVKIILRDVIRTLEPVGYRWLADAREDYCQQASRAKSQIVRMKSKDSSFKWTGQGEWGNLRKPILARLHEATDLIYKLRKLGAVDKDYRQAVNWEQLESFHAEANKMGS